MMLTFYEHIGPVILVSFYDLLTNWFRRSSIVEVNLVTKEKTNTVLINYSRYFIECSTSRRFSTCKGVCKS